MCELLLLQAIYFNCIETGPAFSSRFVYEIYESLPDSTIDTLSAKILSFPNTVSHLYDLYFDPF